MALNDDGQVDGGYLPLEVSEEIPQWLRREEQGTSLFSIALRETETEIDWRYEMAAEILINFFAAIERREMEFWLDDSEIRINRNTIQALFRDPEVLKTAERLNAGHSFKAAQALHECLIDEQTDILMIDIPDLGRVQMRILLRDGLGYTIGIIRNGMYITDNLSYFNEPFTRFPLHKEFAVIIEPEGKDEGEWFRRLENPSHNSLSAEKITDPELRKTGLRVFTELAKEIRNRIRDVARSEPTKSVELDELNEFFVTDGIRTESDEGTEIDPRAKKPAKIVRTSPKPPPPGPGNDDEPGPIPEPGPGPGPGPGSRKGMTPVELVEERALVPDISSPKRRRLFFTSPISSEIVISTHASGLNTSEKLAIVSASIGNVSNTALEIVCEEGERIAVDIEFENAYVGPIEISAYQVTNQEETAS